MKEEYKFYVCYVAADGFGSVFMTSNVDYRKKESYMVELAKYISENYRNGKEVAIVNLIELEDNDENL